MLTYCVGAHTLCALSIQERSTCHSRVFTSPAAFDRRVVIRLRSTLMCLGRPCPPFNHVLCSKVSTRSMAGQWTSKPPCQRAEEEAKRRVSKCSSVASRYAPWSSTVRPVHPRLRFLLLGWQHPSMTVTLCRGVRPQHKMLAGANQEARAVQRETTQDQVLQRFSEYGTIGECNVVSDSAKGPRGFAFVTFHEQASMEKALIVKHIFHGRTVECKRAVSKEDHEASAAAGAGTAEGAAGAAQGGGAGGPAPRGIAYSYSPDGKYQAAGGGHRGPPHQGYGRGAAHPMPRSQRGV